MTICTSALADKGRAIVCIADKSISYGDTIQWDSDSSKMAILDNGTCVMFAGADPEITRVLSKLLAKQDEIGKNVTKTIEVCEKEYKRSLDELLKINFLNPRLLTRKNYVAGTTGPEINSVFRGIVSEMDGFRMQCQLLICGFDLNRKPFIVTVDHPGSAWDCSITGFHAIGAGREKAISRLLFSEFKRTNPTERIVYDCFDAKAFSEMAVGVGFEWDIKIITPDQVFPVSRQMKDLIERVWSEENRSPFEKRKPNDVLPPLQDWRSQLNIYFSRMTNRIPNGRVRVITNTGKAIERKMAQRTKRMKETIDVLNPSKSKRSGARKSKRER